MKITVTGIYSDGKKSKIQLEDNEWEDVLDELAEMWSNEWTNKDMDIRQGTSVPSVYET